MASPDKGEGVAHLIAMSVGAAGRLKPSGSIFRSVGRVLIGGLQLPRFKALAASVATRRSLIDGQFWRRPWIGRKFRVLWGRVGKAMARLDGLRICLSTLVVPEPECGMPAKM